MDEETMRRFLSKVAAGLQAQVELVQQGVCALEAWLSKENGNVEEGVEIFNNYQIRFARFNDHMQQQLGEISRECHRITRAKVHQTDKRLN